MMGRSTALSDMKGDSADSSDSWQNMWQRQNYVADLGDIVLRCLPDHRKQVRLAACRLRTSHGSKAGLGQMDNPPLLKMHGTPSSAAMARPK